MRKRQAWPVLCFLLAACCGGEDARDTSPETAAASGFFLVRPQDSGIDFENHTGTFEKKTYIVEAKGGGVLLLDYDGDGDVDVYCVDGNALTVEDEGRSLNRRSNPAAGNRLYRNEGHWKFTDVTREAGVGDDSYGIGGTVGDYDNDGDPDLFICNWGSNVLYRNDGDGRFTDVTAEAGVAGGDALYSTCAAFFDADGDGDLDLYVSNYVDMGRVIRDHGGEPPGRLRRGIWMYKGPLGLPPQPDILYENRGDGTFRAGGALELVDQAAQDGFQVVPLDVEGDGDADLYVANDSCENFLWRNDGKGRFQNIGAEACVARSENLTMQAGMGVDAADYDQNGLQDLIVTNFANDRNTLYRNRTRSPDDVYFEDVSERSGLGCTVWDKVSWGIGFRDFDQDGYLDIFVSNGHVYPTPRPDFWFRGGLYEQPPNLFRNLGPPKYRFEDVTASMGPGLKPHRLGRGAAFADLDGDGDLDVVQACLNQRLLLLENRLANLGHWLELRLEGTKSNRDGIGTQVTVVADGGRIRQMLEHRLASSFGSSNGPVMHWGLGKAEVAEEVRIRWPSGAVQVFRNVAADRLYLAREGAEELGGVR